MNDDGDAPWLLARRSEHGYTDRPAAALPREPEAVSASYQAHLSADAVRRDREQRVAAWKLAHSEITSALTTFKSNCRADRSLLSAVRVIKRQANMIDRRVVQ